MHCISQLVCLDPRRVIKKVMNLEWLIAAFDRALFIYKQKMLREGFYQQKQIRLKVLPANQGYIWV